MRTTTWTDDHAVVAFDRSTSALGRITQPADGEAASSAVPDAAVADAVVAQASARVDRELAGELRSSLTLLAAVLLPIMVIASLAFAG